MLSLNESTSDLVNPRKIATITKIVTSHVETKITNYTTT